MNNLREGRSDAPDGRQKISEGDATAQASTSASALPSSLPSDAPQSTPSLAGKSSTITSSLSPTVLGSSGVGGGPHESLAEPELLALIIEMRLRAGRSKSTRDRAQDSTSHPKYSSISSNNATSSSLTSSMMALSSSSTSSAVDTLDLCHRKIENLPYEMVDIIKDDVVRLALGYNLITSLPDSFANLSKLRYLNIRANLMSRFPDVLCRLPSLEILDISRNKIKKLPTEPGMLLELRVLSVANNRLKRLPSWISRMRHLRILKIEGNNITWPPPHISAMPSTDKGAISPAESTAGAESTEKSTKDSAASARKHADARQMTTWVHQIKSWIAQHASEEVEADEEKVRLRQGIKEGDRRGDRAEKAQGEEAGSQQQDLITANEAREAEGQRRPSLERDGSEHHFHPDENHRVEPETESAPKKEEEGIEDERRCTSADPPSIWAVPQENRRKTDMRSLGEGTTGEDFHDTALTTSVDTYASDREDAGKVSPTSPRWASQTMVPERRASSPPPPSSSSELNKAAVPVPRVPSMYSSAVDLKAALPILSHESAGESLTSPSSAPMAPSLSRSSHGRNNSHTIGQPTNAFSPSSAAPSLKRSLLRNKKSLPDLRQSHGAILNERQARVDQLGQRSNDSPSPTDEGAIYTHSLLGQKIRRPSNNLATRPPLPQINSHEAPLQGRKGSTSTQGADSPSSSSFLRKMSLPTANLSGSPDDPQHARPFGGRPSVAASPTVDMCSVVDTGAAEPASPAKKGTGTVEVERNSYFRRLSTLPPSTISKAIPLPVLRFIDATRGVLYALSQIHTALRQYVVFATDERMTSQLSRALEIASGTMANLINSLDRFDSVSRTRGGAESNIIRGVLTSCAESVTTFRKVVSVLQIQLKALQSGADVRYTRTLLLLLYGSMAEVANCWNVMAPLVEQILPYLFPSLINRASFDNPEALTIPSQIPSILPSIAEGSSPSSPKSARPQGTPSRPPRRRHAGSFSAHDVAQGATLATTMPVPPLPYTSEGVHSPAVALRKRNAPASLTHIPARTQGNLEAEGDMAESPIGDRSEMNASSRPSTPKQEGDDPVTPTATPQSGATNGNGFPLSTPSSSATGTSAPASSTRYGALMKQNGGAPNSDSPKGASLSSRRTISNVSGGSATSYPPPVPIWDPALRERRGPLSSASSNFATTPFTPYAYADSGKPIVDDHLALLLVRVTSGCLSVCNGLIDHLSSLGVRVGPSFSVGGSRSGATSPSTNTAGARSPESVGTPTLASVSSPNTPSRKARGVASIESSNESSSSATLTVNASSDDYRHAASPSPTISRSGSTSMRKLRELRDQATSTAELVRRLQMTLRKIQEASTGGDDNVEALEEGSEKEPDEAPLPSSSSSSSSHYFVQMQRQQRQAEQRSTSDPLSAVSAYSSSAPMPTMYPTSPSEARKLYQDASQLIKAIVKLSSLIKILLVEQSFPRPLMVSLGDTTVSARDLALHIHFLNGPPPPSTQPTVPQTSAPSAQMH